MVSYYNTIDDIAASGVDTVIIPVGSIEQHGSHLPVGTDYFIAGSLAEAVAERIGAYVIPPLPISTCMEHIGKKGSIFMRPSTFHTMLQDIVLCLKNQGFKRVVVLLGHGGIFAAGPAIRELNAMNDGLQVIKIEPPASKAMKEIEDGDPYNDLHAGEEETSVILYLQEQTVKKDEMMKNDYVPSVPREYMNYASILKLSPTGVWGMPSHASAEKGGKLFELMIEHCVNYIEDAFLHCTESKW